MTVNPANLPLSARLLAMNPYGDRPARRQRKAVKGQLQSAEVQGDYNIWYHRHYGVDKPGKWNKEEAVNPGHRCCIDKDSGFTKGDVDPGAFHCLFFARGCCERGPECHFLHRAANEYDEVRVGITKDIFGRERHSTDREDMGGVGNFNRNSRTLYIANIKYLPGDDVESIVRRHFSEWGDITYVNATPGRPMAFVTYRLRVSAEFAKEAMANQSLDHDDVVNVRWAHDNPQEKRLRPGEAEAEQQQALAAIARTSGMLQQMSQMMPVPPKKRTRDGKEETASAYPDTNQQYDVAGGAAMQHQQSYDALAAQEQQTGFAYAHWAYLTGGELQAAEAAEPSLEEILRAQQEAFGGGDLPDGEAFTEPPAESDDEQASKRAKPEE
eukprot:TRINITY_DN476_c0_g1_i1.p1 TRINITY_DN476_c0_g1~~TRINITY_DN476_c0_g1_i1.p1  ORF type:complete len:383 (+),score=57.28 TRINITY_DN476_c0_g1_i1:1082-2230(+)